MCLVTACFSCSFTRLKMIDPCRFDRTTTRLSGEDLTEIGPWKAEDTNNRALFFCHRALFFCLSVQLILDSKRRSGVDDASDNRALNSTLVNAPACIRMSVFPCIRYACTTYLNSRTYIQTRNISTYVFTRKNARTCGS